MAAQAAAERSRPADSEALGRAAGTVTGTQPSNSGWWTTRRWLVVGASAALAVLAALSALALGVVAHTTTVNNRLVDHSGPGLTESVRLEAALISQEAGIRGYGLTGQRDFLTPYRAGLTQERDSLAQLHTLLAGDPASLGDLQKVESAAEVWQVRFARPLAATPSGAPIPLATERADEARAEFIAVQAASNVQQIRLQKMRDAARAELGHVRTTRAWVFASIGALIVLLTALIFEGLRRGVTRPLGLLSADSRRVSDGDFGHPIQPTGPADLQRLAGQVETMRQRLVEELAFSDRARRQLDEQAADLRRSNAELEQFAYVASHDLQEPLRKVASFSQLLQRRYAGRLDERADQYIGFAVDGATRMQTLINDLLDFSRVGRLHAEYTPVDLEGVFSTTLENLSIAIEESGTRITHDPLPRVNGDATQLGMLLQNLISNAIKFHEPDRAPRIRVEARREDDWWHMAVTDNGIGILSDYADKVFTIFQRLHTKDAYPGNGIGLALCKKIVEFHGGTIAIDPGHSPGTRITFTLPVAA